MFRWFESLVSPYPEREPAPAPRSFAGFMWACSEGMRPFILGMTLCTAVIGVFEAALFAMLGRIVDWLAAVDPAALWPEHRQSLLLLAGILAGSVLVVALQTMLKHHGA
jgi:ATP-binding cassette subfamily B multidrug efflux pump